MTRSYTQQDPIGIAGGLNLYGFANGDPVNFSDPFGLCPDEEDPDCEDEEEEGEQEQGVDETPPDASAANWAAWGGPARIVVGEIAGETTKAVVIAGVVAGTQAAAPSAFARGGWANSNQWLRIGVGRHGGNKVFRIAGRVLGWFKKNPHINLWKIGPLP